VILGVKIIAGVSYGGANALSCVVCYAGTLSNTPAKDDQHHAELNDRFVDHTE